MGLLHDLGQFGGHVLNAAPGYSTLGANITNPNVNYKGAINPPTASNNYHVASTPAATAPAASSPAPDVGSGVYNNPGSGIDPTTGLSYDDLASQANSQLGNLGQQQQVGNQNILDAYNTSFNALQGAKATTDRDYNTSKDQTLQDYVGARGNNQAQVGQQANSLQRLLGAHGYQGSANDAAAYLAARQGSIANNALQGDYGRNQQALDTNYGDYNTKYQGSLADLAHQKQDQQNSLQAQVDTNKQSLLQQLAQIATAKGGNAGAYNPQINQLGQQITALGQQYANPVIQATPPTYTAPTLESYAAPTTQAPTVSTQGLADNINPFLSVLLGQQQKDKSLNNIGA